MEMPLLRDTEILLFPFYKHKLHFHFLERAEDGRGMNEVNSQKRKENKKKCLHRKQKYLFGENGITLVLST